MTPRPPANVAVAGESREQRLRRAFGYPYPRPGTSFLFFNSRHLGPAVHTFDNAAWRGVEHMGPLEVVRGTEDGRPALAREVAAAHGLDLDSMLDDPCVTWTPILAIGSNAGPEQLARKFPTELFPEGLLVPVVQCVLEGLDVVYSPYLSSYGSCTATLEVHSSPGTRCQLFVTYLTQPLAQRMHETEGGYNLCLLKGISLHVATSLEQLQQRERRQQQQQLTNAQEEGVLLPAGADGHGAVLHEVQQYNHAQGTLVLPVEGQPGRVTPVAIAEIPATSRRFPALSQPDMLRTLMHALEGGSSGGDGAVVGGDNCAPQQHQCLDGGQLPAETAADTGSNAGSTSGTSGLCLRPVALPLPAGAAAAAAAADYQGQIHVACTGSSTGRCTGAGVCGMSASNGNTNINHETNELEPQRHHQHQPAQSPRIHDCQRHNHHPPAQLCAAAAATATATAAAAADDGAQAEAMEAAAAVAAAAAAGAAGAAAAAAGADEDLQTWVLHVIRDGPLRKRYLQALQAGASQPFQYGNTEVVLEIGRGARRK